MNRVILGCLVVAVLAIPSFAMADTASGTLVVTGTVASSITVIIESGGTFTGGSTNTGTSALGTISKYGAIPANFTRSTTSSNWTLATTVGVRVEKANSISTVYTLNASLLTAPAGGVTWTLNAVALTTGVQALGSGFTYGLSPTYPLTILIPDSVTSTTTIDNTIVFGAVSA
jgi:hypothetical protein